MSTECVLVHFYVNSCVEDSLAPFEVALFPPSADLPISIDALNQLPD